MKVVDNVIKAQEYPIVKQHDLSHLFMTVYF